jgi:hypothetical protein
MRTFVITAILAMICLMAWRVLGLLSADAIGMAIGMLFGVVFAIPMAILVLRGGNRADSEERQAAPPQTTVYNIILPPHVPSLGYDERTRGMLEGQRGKPALPARRQNVIVDSTGWSRDESSY